MFDTVVLKMDESSVFDNAVNNEKNIKKMVISFSLFTVGSLVYFNLLTSPRLVPNVSSYLSIIELR